MEDKDLFARDPRFEDAPLRMKPVWDALKRLAFWLALFAFMSAAVFLDGHLGHNVPFQDALIVGFVVGFVTTVVVFLLLRGGD